MFTYIVILTVLIRLFRCSDIESSSPMALDRIVVIKERDIFHSSYCDENLVSNIIRICNVSFSEAHEGLVDARLVLFRFIYSICLFLDTTLCVDRSCQQAFLCRYHFDVKTGGSAVIVFTFEKN